MICRRSAGFDWDDSNRSKCQKHGVSIAEIERLFQSMIAVVPDVLHDATEERFKAIGKTLNGRSVFVVFTLRGDLIRPISARYMHAKEVNHYEKATSGF